ncbi:MAG TPA: C40 family peptidase [Casimicrobiaceae bacterium]|nr:C40 family peptidase [Casimicrobiaceae bacterium]
MSRAPFLRAATAALALVVSFTASFAAAETSRAAALAASTKTTVESVWHGAQDLAMYALGLIGVDYRWGGETPDGGLDCSGLVRHVFQQVTGVTLPRTSKELSRIGAPIARGDLKAGDLVFFDTRSFAFSHVGIYLGDDRFIHAPSRGSEVEIAELNNGYWRKHFNGARRLVGVLPGLVPSAEAATIVDAPASVAR